MNEMSLADVVGKASPATPSGRRSRRGQEKRRRSRRRRTGLTVLVALVLIGGAIGGAWVGLRPIIASFTAPTDYAGPGSGSAEVKIPEGATGTAIGEVLQKNGVVLTVKGFVKAYTANARSATIRPGTYGLKLRMTSPAAVDALLDDANRLLDKVTVKEGVRAAEVPGLIAAHTKIGAADLRAALKVPATGLGLPAEAKGDPEGWLFPATYDVEPGTTAAELLQSMVRRTVQELDDLDVPAAERRDTIILASLVQAEAKLPADFPKVARVLENRLGKGMKLQLDTTVHYATQRFTVATSIKDTQFNSPYNTYLVPALPVGAISNPGRAAIQAVRRPTPGPWLYFVAVNPDTGATEYATTPSEFLVIKAKYDKWAKANPGR